MPKGFYLRGMNFIVTYKLISEKRFFLSPRIVLNLYYPDENISIAIKVFFCEPELMEILLAKHFDNSNDLLLILTFL